MIVVVAAVAAGAVASVIRYLVTRVVTAPWGVLVVNVVGSGVGGAVLGLSERAALGDDLRLILLGGFCGGLTTFSTWSVESIQLVRDRKWRVAALSIGANLILGIAAAALAYFSTR